MSSLSLSEHNQAGHTLGGWRLALLGLGFGLALVFACYWQTFLSMVQIWWRSDTFAHGFLIMPISLWLIWRRRQHLAVLVPKTNMHGLWFLALLGFVWLTAQLVDVQVIEQLSFIAMMIALSFTFLGWPVVKEIAFPLAFLFFAVPMGEFLIPPLMDFTADFTVALIQLTGIPVYREGTFFSIPSGDWSVVEGCSGLRYLIASITLGCLYAYLSYRSWWRRLAFIGLSLVFPVIANGLRAFLIVMIAHFSDMKLALGVDHYIYGWVFFGLVMLLMFWMGSFWTEAGDGRDHETPLVASSRAAVGESDWKKFAPAVLLSSLILLVWPVWSSNIRQAVIDRSAPVTLTLPERIAEWKRTEGHLTSWKPHYLYPDASAASDYSDGAHRVALYVLYYRTQEQGRELINSQNYLVRQKHPVWRMPWEKARKIQLPEGSFRVREGILKSPDQQLVVWRWNWIAGRYMINDQLAKLLEARNKLLGRSRDAAAIVVATELSVSPDESRKILEDFTTKLRPVMASLLERTEVTE